ncbi:MAG: response regulator [Dechloromonas sp.]|uniref:Response regulator n=1 Tax=Candidatus Dechloromonas phosphorivorans TaxID=2899244 RepID=A0A935N000_9RHOO|nr:response regulator [Candidatus Dechloromonas phosphorivorans]
MDKTLSVVDDAAEETPSGRILIVDDDPVVAGMLGISLAAAGHSVVEVSSGEEALAWLTESGESTVPDVVFLDIEMGMGIDG